MYAEIATDMDTTARLNDIDLTYLEKKHPFPAFDNAIQFFDEYTTESGEKKEHVYLINNVLYEFSTTTFVHSFFPHFDADKVIASMMSKPSWSKSKYYGMTCEEIKESWEINRVQASTLGTAMHARIEKFYNHPTLWSERNKIVLLEELQKYYSNDEINTPEFQQFLSFHIDTVCDRNWEPWKTEWRVYDPSIQVAGSIDMLYKSEHYSEDNKSLIMLDWKRSKEIRRDNRWEKGYAPISDIPHANYFQYSLQLNVYKRIIESNTPYRIEFMALGVFHPNQDTPMCYHVEDMSTHIDKIWKHRLQQLSISQKKHNFFQPRSASQTN